MQGYTFQGNENMSPEMLEQRRQLVRAMLNANNRTPQNAGEGLHAVGRAIAARIMGRQNERAHARNMKVEELAGQEPPAASPNGQASVVAALMGGSDGMNLQGGAGDDVLAGGGGADMLMPAGSQPLQQMPASPGLMPAGPAMPQGFNATPVAAPEVPLPTDQRAAVAGDPYDPEMMGQEMDAMRFERQPVDGKREFRQDLRTGDGVADLGMNTTEGQVTGYALRAQAAEDTLRQFETEGTRFWSRAAAALPGNTENMLLSPEYQQYLNAEQNFLAAVLRRDTGAAITNEEFRLYRPMFFPQPGDGPEVIAQKRSMREQALLGLRAGAGEGIGVLPPMSGAAQPTTAPQVAGGQAQQGEIPPAPAGVDPADWQYMTPEERALFQ